MLLRELALFLTAIVLSAAATWQIRRRAVHWGLLDVPNARSSHTRPTPRGGGLAIVVTVLAAAIAAVLLRQLPAVDIAALVACGAAVAAVGYCDDLKGLSAPARFVVHLLAAVVAAGVLVGVDAAPAVLSAPLPRWLALAVVIVAVLWSINLFNFMDGIDGIATSESAFIAGASAFLALLAGAHSVWTSLAILTIGSSLGFLVWNWPPAKIFMGDVGSGFLGFWLGSLALGLHFSGTLSIWTSVTLASVFIADATATLLRRMLRGSRWHEAHRSHAYQHLARRWNSHLRVTMLLWTLNVVIALPLAAISVMEPGIAERSRWRPWPGLGYWRCSLVQATVRR